MADRAWPLARITERIRAIGAPLFTACTVTEWIWSNPHCFLKFDVKDENGTVTNWAAEVQNPTDMTRRGWGRTSFRPGDAVTVTVQPVKNGAPVARIRSVILANGQVLSATGPAPAAVPAP